MSARLERTKRERFLPYGYARSALACRVERVALDGHAVESGIDGERHLIELEQTEWRRLSIEGRVDVPQEAMDAFPEDERGAPPAQLFLVARCARTRLRRAFTAGASGAFHLELSHDDVDGALELVPFLTRSTSRQSVPGFASRAGERVASGRAWEIRITPLREPAGKFLDVRYQRFGDDPLLSAVADTLYSLEHERDSPILWINADHEKIVAVLGDRGTRGPRARIREVVFDSIAQSVWTQLFVRAALHLADMGELAYEWEDSTLRELLPGMYRSARTHAARVDALRAQLARGELSAVLAALDTELQRKSSAVEHVTKLIEEHAG